MDGLGLLLLLYLFSSGSGPSSVDIDRYYKFLRDFRDQPEAIAKMKADWIERWGTLPP